MYQRSRASCWQASTDAYSCTSKTTVAMALEGTFSLFKPQSPSPPLTCRREQQDDGTFQLVPECSHAGHVLALFVETRGDFIIVGTPPIHPFSPCKAKACSEPCLVAEAYSYALQAIS